MLYSTCFTHLFLVVCVGMFMGYGGVGCSGLWSRLWEASYGRGCGKLADDEDNGFGATEEYPEVVRCALRTAKTTTDERV